MKQYFFATFSAIALTSCGAKTQLKVDNVSHSQSKEIQISIDSLDISIDGDLIKVVLFRDNFYGMFETNRKNTSGSFKKMIVFTRKGEFIEDVFIPAEIQEMPYYDLIVNNDSLYVKENQFDKINLLLGEYVADFKLTPTKDFTIFKDDTYNIYSTCNGEFGGTIYFQNRQTKKSYEAASTCPIVVNKIDKNYYVTNYMGHMMGFASVIKIPDPEKLEKSNLDFETQHGSMSDKGSQILFDSTGFYIATSFVVDKKLLHLYSDKQGTYIGEIENKKMKHIYKFDFRFSADFSQQLANGKQILTCYFADKKSGILIIDGSNFNFYKLK